MHCNHRLPTLFQSLTQFHYQEAGKTTFTVSPPTPPIWDAKSIRFYPSCFCFPDNSPVLIYTRHLTELTEYNFVSKDNTQSVDTNSQTAG